MEKKAILSNVLEKLKFLLAGPEEIVNLRITLLDQILKIAMLVSIVDFLIGVTLGYPLYYIAVSFSLAISVFGLMRLMGRGHFDYVKYIVLVSPPIIILLTVILYGGNFGEEYLIAINILFAWFLLEKNNRAKRLVYGIVILCYLAGLIYLQQSTPIYAKVDLFFDDVITLLACLYFMFKILGSYQKEIEDSQSRQEDLIQELQVKNKTLEETTQELQQFTYVASHDLKTPIRTIVSFMDLIEYDIKRETYDDLLPKLDFARNGAKQMSNLLKDISTYSEHNFEEKRALEKVSLNSVLDKVRLNLHSLTEDKNATILNTNLPTIWGRESSLIVVFQNLIENGIKYNEGEAPKVTIECTVNDDHFTIQFIDNGIGIEQQYYDRIFMFFKRLHHFNDYPGSGIGLGICKKIITNMNGSVEVSSKVNEGSKFTISFPKEIYIELPINEHKANTEEIEKIGFA